MGGFIAFGDLDGYNVGANIVRPRPIHSTDKQKPRAHTVRPCGFTI